MNPEPTEPTPLEFEVTDFDAARRSLEEPPAGVTTSAAGTPSPYARRHDHGAGDVSIRPETLQWLENLPETYRPEELVRSFPRVANRIASTWDDPEVCAAALDELVLDHRGGRSGFPARVAMELVALRDHCQAPSPLRRR